ncbi:MAG TPA: c-type cytochrome [Pyrinomonadaceae bacterium]|nr:c-type cytochrome [Pyrinomonadaceae bacterium]
MSKASERFKNLKVLGEEPADKIGKIMNIMTESLGVNCSFCHYENDFARDGKEQKETARRMLLMTIEINRNYFSNQPISCNVCHRGRPLPDNGPIFSMTDKIDKRSYIEKSPEHSGKRVDAILNRYKSKVRQKYNTFNQTLKTANKDIVFNAKRIEPNGDIEKEVVTLRPNFYSIVTFYGKTAITEVFENGKASKQVNGSQVALHAFDELQIKREAELKCQPDLSKVYKSFFYLGEDKASKSVAEVIRATDYEGRSDLLFFSAVSSLLIKRVAADPTIIGDYTVSHSYSDYRLLNNGCMYPFWVEFASPGIKWKRKIISIIKRQK